MVASRQGNVFFRSSAPTQTDIYIYFPFMYIYSDPKIQKTLDFVVGEEYDICSWGLNHPYIHILITWL